MGYKDILLSIASVALCMIANSICCEEEKVVACNRKNVACVHALCSCIGMTFEDRSSYYNVVTCSNANEVHEVPKDMPKEVLKL